MLHAAAARPAHGDGATSDSDVYQRLDVLIAQLSAAHVDQRVGALKSIQFKIQCGIVLVSDLAHKESLLKALLEWFNQDAVSHYEQVLNMLLLFAEVC